MSEDFYIQQDDFIRYIQREVNPERVKVGLKEVGIDEARLCFSIIYDFRESWMKP